MKRALLLLALPGVVYAAPTLYADPHSATGPQPAAAEWSSDGTAWKPCAITAREPACDLASIGAAGSYTLRMRYVYTAGCLGEVCWSAGAASSDPFAFVWQGVPASRPSGLGLRP